ncbi:hypothetical protein FQA39_LY00277 [Lamprigera yunnana]|nr:hypothetical protein FQA39_LY00277 [Lamprigera yunnana]
METLGKLGLNSSPVSDTCQNGERKSMEFALIIEEDKLVYWLGQMDLKKSTGLRGVSKATVHVTTTLGSVIWSISCRELLVTLIVITVILHPMYPEYMNANVLAPGN